MSVDCVKMERWVNRVAVITGSASGIGEACARVLLESGLRVVGLDISDQSESRSKLPAELQKRYYVRKCDITKDDEVKETFNWIEKNLGGTDILVNNAGVCLQGNILEMEMKQVDKVLNTNFRALVYCTQQAFKSMKARKFDGHFIHINSIVGLSAVSISALSPNVYACGKYAVTAFNEVVRQELNAMNLNIKSTSIHPGVVNTNILTKDQFGQLGIKHFIEPEDVAENVKYVISTPPNVLIRELTVKPMGETV